MSRGLGQGELLEVAPSRRLIVPAGCVYWWGVDASTRGVSVATVAPDGLRGVSSSPFSRREAGGTRLREIRARTRDLAAELAGASLCPGVVAVEQPSGKQPNPALSYAVGVVIEAIADAVAPVRVHVEMVTSSAWKALACGKGNIYKPKPREPGEYGVLTWARAAGYAGSSWDEADAWGIAEWARRTFVLDAR